MSFVIVHGFNSHSGYYAWVAEQLVLAGFAVYALDLRGRGQSDGERFYVEVFADYVGDLSAFVGLVKGGNSVFPSSCSVTAPVALSHACRASITNRN